MSTNDENQAFAAIALRSLAGVACDATSSAPARVKAAQAMLSYLLALSGGSSKSRVEPTKRPKVERTPAELADDLAELRKTRANQAIQALK